MNPRTTGLLLVAALALGAFVYFYEMEGESARLEAQEREDRLFGGFEAEDVDWIALTTSDGVDARFEREGDAWQLVAPVAHPADAAVARMAEGLATITHEDVFEDPQPDAEYGLDDASARIVRFGVGDVEHELRIGRETPVGSKRYAKTDARDAVYTVEGFRRAAFERPLTDLRDKQILAFDQSAVRSLEARWPEGRVVLERVVADVDKDKGSGSDSEGMDAAAALVADTWQMRVPLAAEGDTATIDRLLATLAFLRADGFVDAQDAAVEALLEPPAYAVALRSDEADAEATTLVIGREDPENGRPVRNGAGRTFWIGAERIDDFPRDPVDYRDRTLARLSPSEIEQLDFYFQSAEGDPTAIHATRGDEGWTSTPEAFAEGKLAAIASELGRLEAVDILAESMGEAELEGIGLSPPLAILTAFGAAPEAEAAEGELPPQSPVLAEIQFGKVTSEGVVARRAGRDTIYRLGIAVLETIPISLEAFRNRFQPPPEAEAPLPPPAEEGVDWIDAAEESP